MEKDTHITEVIFRVMDSEVIALFPYEINTMSGNISSYMHIGQHSSACYHHCVQKSKLATEEEYRDLKTELESIGYNLKVIKKINYDKYDKAKKELLKLFLI